VVQPTESIGRFFACWGAKAIRRVRRGAERDHKALVRERVSRAVRAAFVLATALAVAMAGGAAIRIF
jgi:hypothetical protein